MAKIETKLKAEPKDLTRVKAIIKVRALTQVKVSNQAKVFAAKGPRPWFPNVLQMKVNRVICIIVVVDISNAIVVDKTGVPIPKPNPAV